VSIAYIAIGSNLGDRHSNIDVAVGMLSEIELTCLIAVAMPIGTAPVNCPVDSPAFINTCASVNTELTPSQLLQAIQSIEQTIGRVRSTRNAPRLIDLDLLMFDDLILEQADLILPHPRMHQRRFVLEPISQLAPQLVHPTFSLSMLELLHRLGDA